MKILVFNGSPKGNAGNSNTMHVTRAFLEGAGFEDAEIIDVSKQKITPCAGCYACWTKTPGKCIFRDDMDTILEKRVSADVVIWSFPLYYYSLPSGIKALMDRQLPMGKAKMGSDHESGSHVGRYDVSHQRHVLISTCGFWTAEGNYGSVTAQFDRILKEKGVHYDSLFCAQGGAISNPDAKRFFDKYMETVKQAGAEFAKGKISEETLDKISTPVLPKEIYNSAADASWGIDHDKDDKTPHDNSFVFTKQMAAFYKHDGTDRVLEMHYTDINKTYQIVMTAKGAEVISEGFKKSTTRIETPFSLWRDISKGDADGQAALFQKKYKVVGDFSLMMKFDEIFGDSSESAKKEVFAEEKSALKTNMKVLLLPWLALLIASSFDPIIGGVVGIAAIALVPMWWIKHQPVIYEKITLIFMGAVSAALLLGVDVRMVTAIGNFSYGLMWLGSAFTKTSLTAHYSYNNYDDGEALRNNPFFIKINRILTVGWGVLFCAVALSMYLLVGLGLPSLVVMAIRYLPMAAMGAFTAWYPEWYMSRWSGGC
ncbi:MAG: NAD(P)H-dependent oxidoreductase [Defluviitaleaceae bacterium]|nr:NAD(P)H-dependent oxidoreductase [Defluviitaleaceae bacterium]MCL2224920.1 NAD(P)H-dependent oxidoreductase [Defluviitaleaceae bacterium]MCL2262518.1 NAD(P)H-dependent oxidoreductase [Defluviitaleaceae bacterium]